MPSGTGQPLPLWATCASSLHEGHLVIPEAGLCGRKKNCVGMGNIFWEKKKKKEGKIEKGRKTNRLMERQRNTIISTCSPSVQMKESESHNQFQNRHVMKLQPALSAKSSVSVQQKHTGKRALKVWSGDFYI